MSRANPKVLTGSAYGAYLAYVTYATQDGKQGYFAKYILVPKPFCSHAFWLREHRCDRIFSPEEMSTAERRADALTFTPVGNRVSSLPVFMPGCIIVITS